MLASVPLGTLQVLVETIGKFLFFPIWWYSFGLVKLVRLLVHSLEEQYKNWQLGVWVKNLFVPMYGTSDIMGRIISFGVRLFMITVKGSVVFLWFILLLVIFLVYLLFLPLTVFGLLFHGYVFFL